MNTERKPRYRNLTRRGEQRLMKTNLYFDLTVGGLALVIILCMIVCHGQPYELGEKNSAGFPLWFLLSLAYLPLEAMGIVNWCIGAQDSALMRFLVEDPHQALGLGIFNLSLLLLVWGAIRFYFGRRYGSPFLKTSGNFVLVFFVWGVFQLGCMAAVEIWDHGGFSPLHRHLNREAEPEKVIVVTAEP